MPVALTREELEKTAQVAHIALEADELAELTEQLNGVLAQIDKLKSLDAAGVEPMTHGTDAENVMRPDDVRPSLTQEQALANAPDAASGGFRVPKILDS